MANVTVKNSITISKDSAQKAGGFVILPIKQYEKLREQSVPTYYLTGKEAKDLDKLVEDGLKAYEKGETISASSMREALEVYGKKKHK
jgi:hypothetical protein